MEVAVMIDGVGVDGGGDNGCNGGSRDGRCR